jgi:hypothetical protein
LQPPTHAVCRVPPNMKMRLYRRNPLPRQCRLLSLVLQYRQHGDGNNLHGTNNNRVFVLIPSNL